MISRRYRISAVKILLRRISEIRISLIEIYAIRISAIRISMCRVFVICFLVLSIVLSGCGKIASVDPSAASEAELTPPVQETAAEPEAMVTLEAGQNILLKIHGEIEDEMLKPRSLIYGVGIGWTVIDGEVTGFGPSGKESRVVAEVDSTVYDSYVEKWSKLYGDMVYVESVTAIMKDQVSTYSDLLNQDTSVIMKAEYDSYEYGTKEATLLISNHTEQDIMHDDMEIYEKLVDGVWYTIFQDFYSDCVGYMVMANDMSKYKLYIPIDLLDFEKGTYRVIKEINDNYYSAEFSIQ